MSDTKRDCTCGTGKDLVLPCPVHPTANVLNLDWRDKPRPVDDLSREELERAVGIANETIERLRHDRRTDGKTIAELDDALREAREELASCEKVRRIESQSHDRKLREAREERAAAYGLHNNASVMLQAETARAEKAEQEAARLRSILSGDIDCHNCAHEDLDQCPECDDFYSNYTPTGTEE